MKKSLLALAILGTFAGVASAQSSVTLYGLVDAGISRETGATSGSIVKLATGVQSGNRWGLRGSEDLGGGLKANFQLESGFNLDDGSGRQGALFGRQAWVGLNGGFGAVSMGRQYSLVFLALDTVDPFDYGLTGAISNLVVDAPFRLNNSIKYSSPSFGGFTAEAMYGFGEVAGNNSANRQYELAAKYAQGPIFVQLAHNNGQNATGTDALKITALAASYDFGVAKAALSYNVNKNTATINSADLMVGVTVPFGASTVLASYVRKNDKTALNADASQAAIGYTYALSKRTNFYTSYSRISNKNSARYTVGDASGGGAAAADRLPGTPSTGFAVGVRHRF